jgi:succinate dehydrogenase hydrophobic anchor subunit
MSSRTVPQRGFNFDYLMFLFTRISGLSIILLAIIGVAGAFYMGARTQMELGTLVRWTFFPNPNHVINSDIPDVTLGWANAYWNIMQMLIVFFAFTHAANGLRMIRKTISTAHRPDPAARLLVPVVGVLDDPGLQRDHCHVTPGFQGE